MSLTDFDHIQTKAEPAPRSRPLDPTREELAVLSRTERAAFRLTHRMNRGRWKGDYGSLVEDRVRPLYEALKAGPGREERFTTRLA